MTSHPSLTRTGEGNGNPTPVLLPGKSHGRRSLEGCGPWGRWGSDTTERLHFHFSLSCIGGGNGNPLRCSCLENPRDRGAWWAAVYGVTQSRTRLKWLRSSTAASGLCGIKIKTASVDAGAEEWEFTWVTHFWCTEWGDQLAPFCQGLARFKLQKSVWLPQLRQASHSPYFPIRSCCWIFQKRHTTLATKCSTSLSRFDLFSFKVFVFFF